MSPLRKVFFVIAIRQLADCFGLCPRNDVYEDFSEWTQLLIPKCRDFAKAQLLTLQTNNIFVNCIVKNIYVSFTLCKQYNIL